MLGSIDQGLSETFTARLSSAFILNDSVEKSLLKGSEKKYDLISLFASR